MEDIGGFDALGFSAAVEAGLAARKCRDDRLALRCFQRAARIRQTQFVLTQLGVCQRQLGNYRESRRHYEAALARSDGDGLHALTGLIATLCDVEEREEAYRRTMQLVRRQPHAPSTYEVLARVVALYVAWSKTQAPGASLDAMYEAIAAMQRLARRGRPKFQRPQPSPEDAATYRWAARASQPTESCRFPPPQPSPEPAIPPKPFRLQPEVTSATARHTTHPATVWDPLRRTATGGGLRLPQSPI